MIEPYKFTAARCIVDILSRIDIYGDETKPRDQRVKEICCEHMSINPIYPIANFKEKPFNYKYLCHELRWYLSKDKNPDEIIKASKFWNKLRDDNGNVNSNYGERLLGKQLRWVYDSLIKDIDSRQAIAFINEPKFQYENNKDFPCTLNLLFFIRYNQLFCRVNMRSQDIWRGFSYDIPFFSLILQQMYLWLKETYTDLELGTLVHHVDNIHYYEQHFDISEQILKSSKLITMEHNQPKFEMKTRIFDIDENGEFSLRQNAIDFCYTVNHIWKIEQTGEDIKDAYIDCLNVLNNLIP